MTLQSLIGNPRVKTLLQSLTLKNTLPHVLLFHGPKGVGKSTFAKNFIEELLKKSKTTLDVSSHPDIRHYYPEGKTSMHPISKMHELIKEAKIPPFEANQKFFVIHESDRMLPSSSNSLLKILEEPEDGVHFILLTNHLELMLSTVTSRAIKITFSEVSDSAMDAFLGNYPDITLDRKREIIFLANGSFLKAKEIIDNTEDNLTPRLIEMLTYGMHGAYKELLSTLKEIDLIAEDRTRFDEVLNVIYYWYRDLELIKRQASESLLFFHNYQKELQSCLKCTIPSLEKIHQALKKMRYSLSVNIKLRHVLEQFFLEYHF